MMDNTVIRLDKIGITNFRNVLYGEIDLSRKSKFSEASILGLYGQNGSGKTSLINAISLLKHALCGHTVPKYYADYINVNSENAKLEYFFSITNSEEKFEYKVVYSFYLKKVVDEIPLNTDILSRKDNYKVVIYDENLRCSYKSYVNDIYKNLTPIIDTKDSDTFLPETKYEILVSKDKETNTDLIVAKKLTYATSRSFIFSPELLNIIRAKCTEQYLVDLFNHLTNFGNFGLFIIDTQTTGLINVNAALPLVLKYERENRGMIGNFMVSLSEDTGVPEEMFDIVQEVIASMNIVLKQLVPNLTIGIKDKGHDLSPTGEKLIKIQLVSMKNDKEIPLVYESDGIKKIISILQLLIVVYNFPSITIAIDELDSGVFEYLLGEILKIISERGKGQLIFTSHNLRPLETLDKNFVAFTTTNPYNRYIRMSNIKSNNNLRDYYYRDIMIGNQDEPLYDYTNNSDIAIAFMEAGAAGAY